MDAGYPSIRERDQALEELRQSVEQLAEVVAYLLGDEEDLLPAEVVPELESEIEERRRTS